MGSQWFLMAALCGACVVEQGEDGAPDEGESTGDDEFRAGSGGGSGSGSGSGTCSSSGSGSGGGSSSGSGTGTGSGSGSGSSSGSAFCDDVMGTTCTSGATSSCITEDGLVPGTSKSICCRCDILPSGEVTHTWQDCLDPGDGFPVG